MAFFTNLFSPATYAAYSRSDRTTSGFRETQRAMADKINPGDVFLCYMTKLSRWCGELEILDGPFIDRTPIFVTDEDPFVVRFHVNPRIWLDRDATIPIQSDMLWPHLSFTEGHERGTAGWIGPLRRSLQAISDADAKVIRAALEAQVTSPTLHPIENDAWSRHMPTVVAREDRVVEVTVPDTENDPEGAEAPSAGLRDSHKMQAKLAVLGERMGYRVWAPKNDRHAMLQAWSPDDGSLLKRLPLNYDDTTLRTIENIDLLWLKGRSIVRAFEIEHTTAIYSGILRMADLLALQPNIDIRLHIVAPESRKQKVFDEIRRPVFSLLDMKPLSEACTFLSYDSIEEVARLPHLQHLSPAVLDEYAEPAE